MTAKYTRHVALTGLLARYVEGQVATGVYASVSEVVRAGLRFLIEHDKARRVNSRKHRVRHPVHDLDDGAARSDV